MLSPTTPSPWLALAIGQSVVWFFLLPLFCRPHWNDIFGNMSPLSAEIIINLTPFCVLNLYSISMIPIYYMNHPFFEQYKISSAAWPWLNKDKTIRRNFWRLSLQSVALSYTNLLILAPFLACVKYKIAPHLTNINHATDKWPTHLEMLRGNLSLMIVHNIIYYWMHRLMHRIPTLYRNFHKVHHQYKQNNVLASQHFHPIDFLISIILPLMLAMLIVKTHTFVNFQWLTWISVMNLDDHVGYAFPWSPIRWVPLVSGTDHHEFHHSSMEKIMGGSCYGSNFMMDWVWHSEGSYPKWRSATKGD